MPQYDNSNSGMLGRNQGKDESHPKWPDYQGQCEVNGQNLWISGWVQTSKKTGEKFISLKFKPKEQQAAKPQSKMQEPDEAKGDVNSDGLPF